jgi:long-chain acyl-CoA synthetase
MITSAALDSVNAGDRIVISAPNSPELLEFVGYCLNAAVIPAMASFQAKQREVDEMARDIGATLVVHGDDITNWARSGLHDTNTPLTRELPKCRPMHFTSGTSGRPKAVWSGWLSPSSARAWIDDEIDAWGLRSDDVHLVCGPLNHSAPLRFALMTLWAGGSVLVPGKFVAQTVADALPMATTSFMAPTHLQRLMEFADGRQLRHGLRLLAHAGATCPDRVRRWTHEVFGLDAVYEFYGSSEGQFTQCPAREWIERPGTVGRARPGREIRVDADGLIWCTAPDYARFEYWGDPETTSAAWDGDWFCVGDYGRMDVDGYVYLEGRRGDLIISGGVNVYPAEIERVLMNLDGVQQVVAFGLPDETWGQRVCVAVTGSVDADAIDEFTREQLSGAKRPKSVFIADQFPTTHSGKVDRKAVAEMFASTATD